jgi:hypothetical protein
MQNDRTVHIRTLMHCSKLCPRGSFACTPSLSGTCRAPQVYTTCGTEAKRRALLARFPGLDPERIGDSRSCAFEALVRRGTGGRGADLVLNSLAGDKLQARARAPRYGVRATRAQRCHMCRSALYHPSVA